MRLEVIQCDICKKQHDAEYQLPTQWTRTLHYDKHGTEQEKHFCSKACLIAGANEREEEA